MRTLGVTAGSDKQTKEAVKPSASPADKARVNKDRVLKETLKEATGTTGKAHRSNAEELINKRGEIKVKGNLAVCDGGGGSLGHPVEYIQLNLQKDVPAVCKYCGLKFVQDHDHHHHH